MAIPEKNLVYVSKDIPVYKSIKHKQSHIDPYITGDIACNSYYKINEDINCLKELGVSILLTS